MYDNVMFLEVFLLTLIDDVVEDIFDLIFTVRYQYCNVCFLRHEEV